MAVISTYDLIFIFRGYECNHTNALWLFIIGHRPSMITKPNFLLFFNWLKLNSFHLCTVSFAFLLLQISLLLYLVLYLVTLPVEF